MCAKTTLHGIRATGLSEDGLMELLHGRLGMSRSQVEGAIAEANESPGVMTRYGEAEVTLHGATYTVNGV